jgi:hypothetical protein
MNLIVEAEEQLSKQGTAWTRNGTGTAFPGRPPPSMGPTLLKPEARSPLYERELRYQSTVRRSPSSKFTLGL